MLTTANVVDVSPLTEERLLAGVTSLLEARARRGCRRSSLVRQHLLGKDLGRQGRKRGDSTFEVVSVPKEEEMRVRSGWRKFTLWMYSPVTLHMGPLQIARAKRDLARIAGEWMRGAVHSWNGLVLCNCRHNFLIQF